MKAIDTRGKLTNEFVNAKIPKDILDNVCNFGKSESTCRYIMLTIEGFVCAKHTTMGQTLDKMAAEEKMSARSDNCKGINIEHAKKENKEEVSSKD